MKKSTIAGVSVFLLLNIITAGFLIFRHLFFGLELGGVLPNLSGVFSADEYSMFKTLMLMIPGFISDFCLMIFFSKNKPVLISAVLSLALVLLSTPLTTRESAVFRVLHIFFAIAVVGVTVAVVKATVDVLKDEKNFKLLN